MKSTRHWPVSAGILGSIFFVALYAADPPPHWPRHIIGTGNGADGIDAVDIDHDGDMDVVVPWEEDGVVKVYLNPGSKPTRHWPAVDISGGLDVTGVEDAIFADFDNNGSVDAVVSSIEDEDSFPVGANSRVAIHWLVDPTNPGAPSAWRGTSLTRDRALYLRARLGRMNAEGSTGIVVGTKQKYGFPGRVLLFQAPPEASPATIDQWVGYDLGSLYRTNNLELTDMDGDGDNDIVISGAPGIAWLRNPGTPISVPWQKIQISSGGSQFGLCDINGDGVLDIIASYKANPMVAGVWYKRIDAKGETWRPYAILPEGGVPMDPAANDYTPKGLGCADMDLDGKLDIVFTASGTGAAVFYVSYRGATPEYSGNWDKVLISERTTAKYDNLILADIDEDGDKDVVSTEEKQGIFGNGLGALWYENPVL